MGSSEGCPLTLEYDVLEFSIFFFTFKCIIHVHCMSDPYLYAAVELVYKFDEKFTESV